MEQQIAELSKENILLQGEGGVKAENEKLLTEHELLQSNITTLTVDVETIQKTKEKLLFDTDDTLKLMVNLINQLNQDISTETINNQTIFNAITELKDGINSKRWFIPRVPLDYHHDNNYEVIRQPQNENECFVKIKTSSSPESYEYVKGVCYTETKNVKISDGYDYGSNGSSDPTYENRVIITFKADDNSKDIGTLNRYDTKYYKLREGLQTPLDAVLSKCYADFKANVSYINSSISPIEYNNDADTKNNLLLQRIQNEVVRIIRRLEEQIKSQSQKTIENTNKINKMKRQFESKCWIIPQVPLDSHHPNNYEIVKQVK